MAAGWDKKKSKTALDNMDKELDRLKSALNALDADLTSLQKGDGTTAYWCGKRAYKWVYDSLKKVKREKKLRNFLDAIGTSMRTLIDYGDKYDNA